jgi:catechol 2,3-dioxygenase-like lactoylglutathione lyase family enzyme
MPVDLHHVLVHATDPRASAQFLAEILDLPAGPPTGPCFPVRTANAVALEFVHDGTPFTEQHCAFLVDPDSFDGALLRLRDLRACIWGDATRRRPDQVDHRHRRRRVYFDDPDGHLMQLVTGT